MRHMVLAFVLALTIASWAQTATQTTPSTSQQSAVPAEKAKCACCDRMAASSSKEAHACCAHQQADSKEIASCRAGKDAKSCGAGQDAKSCMKDGKTATACGEDCCGKDKTATKCCDKSAKGCAKNCCSQMNKEKSA